MTFLYVFCLFAGIREFDILEDESEQLHREQKRSGTLEALVNWHKKIWRMRSIPYEYDNVFTGTLLLHSVSNTFRPYLVRRNF